VMPKKVVLISGGAGFLGSHLCDWFINRGFKVIAVDNLLTGSLRNVAHLRTNKDFKFIKQDVSVAFTVGVHVDYVMHFASPASPVDYAKHPIATMLVGSYGTHNMLEIARRKKAVFLMASTSEVYGDPLVHPQKEGYWGNVNPNGPRSIYDEAKRYAEAAVFAYKRVYKMDVKVVRIFNTYGPRMQIKDGRVVPNFIDQILHHQPLTVYGNGKQTRSFCYVDDLIDGITKLLFSKISGPVNVGNPREFTILQFARLIRREYNPKAKIVFYPLPVDDPKQRRPDISLARKELGWGPKVNLEDGIGRTMDWFAKNYGH
jgi:dTDP-glucose 4,6-dehydratase